MEVRSSAVVVFSGVSYTIFCSFYFRSMPSDSRSDISSFCHIHYHYLYGLSIPFLLLLLCYALSYYLSIFKQFHCEE